MDLNFSTYSFKSKLSLFEIIQKDHLKGGTRKKVGYSWMIAFI